MPTRLLLTMDTSLPAEVLQAGNDFCARLAASLNESVTLASLAPGVVEEFRAWVVASTKGVGFVDVEPPPPTDPTVMSSAPFVYREDGRPDWSTMWQSFCELALYGGPPQRGPDDPIIARGGESTEVNEAITEIRRGIWETTGLFAEPGSPSWMAVTCHSKRMAAWMCAAIILENVDARCEDEILYVPASPSFELKDEVKSVITVVAKVNHYWQAHVSSVAAQQAAKTEA